MTTVAPFSIECDDCGDVVVIPRIGQVSCSCAGTLWSIGKSVTTRYVPLPPLDNEQEAETARLRGLLEDAILALRHKTAPFAHAHSPNACDACVEAEAVLSRIDDDNPAIDCNHVDLLHDDCDLCYGAGQS